jgi:hypothetical protein
MRRFTQMAAALAIVALVCVVGAGVAAAEDGPPAFLVLEGKVTDLSFSGSDATQVTTLTNLEGKEIKGKGLSATLNGCTTLEGKEKDTAHCTTGLLTFTEFKQGELACRSETLAGVKDPIETILVKTTALLGAEKSTAGVLQPLLVRTPLGVDGNPLLINCAALKETIIGQIGCLLLPGLTEIAAGGTIEVLCKTKSAGDQETGTCEVTKALCEALAKNPFEAKLNGVTFSMAALTWHLNLTANKNIFIDD